jgi:murein DD-endopeptidase MepM/ murein hydrolase activator NlpD
MSKSGYKNNYHPPGRLSTIISISAIVPHDFSAGTSARLARWVGLRLAVLAWLALWPAGALALDFESPLTGRAGVDWFLINFKDHGDGTTPLDYTGGRQTYPTHTGIDIMLFDFLTMDQGIDVLAAAPGTVLRYVDGLDDRALEGQPNALFLRHADGSVSYYAHFKMNSILVSTGQVVGLGQKLGRVGADGTNDVAHLHFGVLNEWTTNAVWCEIMTNQSGLSQSFDWFDNYSNQVINHVVGMGITHTNDPVTSLPAWRQQQTPSSYSQIHSGPFYAWIKYTGRRTNDVLVIRLLNVAGPGATIDFTPCGWHTSSYVIYHLLLWDSAWLKASLSNGTTYKLQYQWNGGEWRDGPGANTFTVADERQEIYLSRISLAAYANAPPAPAGLAAGGGLDTNGVRLTWSPSSNCVHYAVYRGESNTLASAAPLVLTSNPGYDDTSAAPETIYYYWVAAANAAGTSGCTGPVAGWSAEPAGTGPDLRINQHHRPVETRAGEPVTVTVQLDPGIYNGIEADWWVAALVNETWYYLDSVTGWTMFDGNLLNCRPVYQGPLINLAPTTVLDYRGLPVGISRFWFAVDPRDGRLNVEGPILYDTLAVTVCPD